MKTIKYYISIIAIAICFVIPNANVKAATTPTVSVNTVASPSLKYMADGNLFDPVYYKKTYPAVMAYFEKTNGFCKDEDLYNHYLTSGKAQGYMPYAPSATPIQVYDFVTVKQYETVVLNMPDVLETHMVNNIPMTVYLSDGVGVTMVGDKYYGLYLFSNCWPVNPEFALFGLPNIGLCGTNDGAWDPIMVGPNFLAEIK
ncbi:hypothetical protein [Lachnoclostridium sp. Marseille-P6806]|uniref:hypothetical protein n=1 Tax=Lachnoclostridium sp. Marseille-P6806 TaxID=2364793 RepID=UPI00102F5166|nr:hypothetical protein [Lachnoclostridium sp. Marseille-P6806]